MSLKQAIKAKLSARGFRVFKPDQVVSMPLLVEIIELLEKDLDSKLTKKNLELKQLEDKLLEVQTELAFLRSCVLENTDY